MMRLAIKGIIHSLCAAGIIGTGFFLFFIAAPPPLEASPLENSCIQCHQGLKEARLTRPVALWKKSIHAEVGNTCEGCHGGDPNDASMASMAPVKKFQGVPQGDTVPEFCGKCHADLLDFYRDSPHGMMGTPHCVDCHGSHEIRRFSSTILTPDACSECHSFDYSQQLQTRFESLRGDFSHLEDAGNSVSGFPTQTLDKPLKQARDQFRRARSALHTFDKNRMEEALDKVTGHLEGARQAQQNLRSLQIKRERVGWGSLLLFFLLAAVTFFWNRESRNP